MEPKKDKKPKKKAEKGAPSTPTVPKNKPENYFLSVFKCRPEDSFLANLGSTLEQWELAKKAMKEKKVIEEKIFIIDRKTGEIKELQKK